METRLTPLFSFSPHDNYFAIADQIHNAMSLITVGNFFFESEAYHANLDLLDSYVP